MRILLDVLLMLLQLYWWVVIIMIVMSWLFAFKVVNSSNQFVASLWRIVNGLTEPVLRPIRRIIPNISGIDLSPLALFIGIYVAQQVIIQYIRPYAF
ncbi:MAG: YggT family protein [Alphaproteobacteria bacterium]|nr:YggT family protein [Alphaproteobacteria bacterium]